VSLQNRLKATELGLSVAQNQEQFERLYMQFAPDANPENIPQFIKQGADKIKISTPAYDLEGSNAKVQAFQKALADDPGVLTKPGALEKFLAKHDMGGLTFSVKDPNSGKSMVYTENGFQFADAAVGQQMGIDPNKVISATGNKEPWRDALERKSKEDLVKRRRQLSDNYNKILSGMDIYMPDDPKSKEAMSRIQAEMNAIDDMLGGGKKDETAEMADMPDPAKHNGRKIRDNETGQIYVSNGREWVPETTR
jgi:hypothetical protein